MQRSSAASARARNTRYTACSLFHGQSYRRPQRSSGTAENGYSHDAAYEPTTGTDARKAFQISEFFRKLFLIRIQNTDPGTQNLNPDPKTRPQTPGPDPRTLKSDPEDPKSGQIRSNLAKKWHFSTPFLALLSPGRPLFGPKKTDFSTLRDRKFEKLAKFSDFSTPGQEGPKFRKNDEFFEFSTPGRPQVFFYRGPEMTL